MNTKVVTIKAIQTKKSSMNNDLQQWLTEEKHAKLEKNINHHLSEKKPQGMCELCGMKTAKSVCIKCGRSVCNSCFFHLVSLCEKCVSKETVESWKKKKQDWKKVLGVDWVD